MIGSKSHFFTQNKDILGEKYADIDAYLKLKGYAKNQIQIYLKAFIYFADHPENFDGATIVKDLCDIPDLDLDAMLHDYHYCVYNVAANVAMKWKADWIYAKGQERKGKGLYPAYSRFTGLSLIGIGFIPFARLKRGKMTNEQKEVFLRDYNILI